MLLAENQLVWILRSLKVQHYIGPLCILWNPQRKCFVGAQPPKIEKSQKALVATCAFITIITLQILADWSSIELSSKIQCVYTISATLLVYQHYQLHRKHADIISLLNRALQFEKTENGKPNSWMIPKKLNTNCKL